jgi:aspartate aminotransferase
MPRTYAPSSNVSALKESATIAVSARARELRAAGRAVIDLGAGEPDFETPEFIRRAAQRAIDAGATKYTAMEGILPLRQAIAADANATWRGADRIEPVDVVVSTGSKQSLFNACFVLFGPGDEVLVPTPAWTSYYEMVSLAKAVAVPVIGERERGLKVTADALRDAATPRTRGLMLNSPCNPTGAVYDRDELAAIFALAAERGWWVISDEIYVRIVYDTPAPSALEVAPSRERLVVVNGVAKAYAMTGWRIGWAVAPRAVAQAMTAFQSHTTGNAVTVAQHAALAALREREAAGAATAAMVEEFRRRRDALVDLFGAERELPFVRPSGAFYLFVDVTAAAPEASEPGTVVARRLLEEYDVAVVPGEAFLAPSWVRLSYAAPYDDVLEGARRLIRLLRTMREEARDTAAAAAVAGARRG